MKTRRTLLALVLSIMMVIGLFPVTAMAEDSNYYLAYNAETKTFVSTKIPSDIAEVSTANWKGSTPISGWYIARGTVEISSRVTVSGDVHLILANDCELTVNGGIQVDGSNSLTIYAQSTNESTMGNLIAQNVTGEFGAIGVQNGPLSGTITINGGSVQAVGSNGPNNSYGIRATNVTVNGGSVQAVGSNWLNNSYGIIAYNVTVNGGSVEAKGGNAKNNSHGISATNVTVNGGSVLSEGGSANNSNGIFSGKYMTVNGGSVKAVGGNVTNASYGIYANNVTVNGGSVEAEGGSVEAEGGSANNSSYGIYAWEYMTVNGGSVEAKGGSANESYGIFATNVTVTGGSAVVFASSIPNSTDRKNWNGIVFVGNVGQVYGNATIPNGVTLTVPNDATLTVPNGAPLTIAENATLTVAEGATLTIANDATLTNNGTIIVAGTVVGVTNDVVLYYPIEIASMDNGSVTVNASYKTEKYIAEKKDTSITLTVTPNTGYKIASLTVKKSSNPEIQVLDNKFTMPAEKVTVSATFEKIMYTVYFPPVENGQIGADRTSAQMGDTVKLTATPETGYHFVSWNVTGSNNEPISVVNNQFTMPAENVTVSAVFEADVIDVPVQPETPSEPEYIPIPDPDYTAPVYRDTWHKSGKNWYFYDEDGQKVKGWYKDGNTWYYLSEKTGAMVYGGMLEIDGETYYFYDWGGMASNWWYLDETTGAWYYFRGNGAMAKNTWIEWKGEWYYLGADGRMLTGTTTPDGYRVDVNGKWIR